jgi:hypothetical protein
MSGINDIYSIILAGTCNTAMIATGVLIDSAVAIYKEQDVDIVLKQKDTDTALKKKDMDIVLKKKIQTPH